MLSHILTAHPDSRTQYRTMWAEPSSLLSSHADTALRAFSYSLPERQPDYACTLASLSSFENSKFPEIRKSVDIISLNKCIPSVSVSDTRPVVNLAHLSEIFGRLAANQLVPYFEQNTIFDPMQTGLRKFHNTRTTPIKAVDDASKAIGDWCFTILVL